MAWERRILCAMTIEHRIISLGALAAHPLWNETSPVRTPHATTTLITGQDGSVLVNPSLPGTILTARLGERSAVEASGITQLFLTSLAYDHCRGLDAFPSVPWYAFEPEIDFQHRQVREDLQQAEDYGDTEAVAMLERHALLLDQVRPAADQLMPGVDLFPLPGLTPGTCGLLLPLPRQTVLISGDAVATREHLDRGQVLPSCVDLEQAQESFREAIQIADLIIPGRDNLLVR